MPDTGQIGGAPSLLPLLGSGKWYCLLCCLCDLIHWEPTSSAFFKDRFVFFWGILGSQQNWAESPVSSHTPPPSVHAQPFCCREVQFDKPTLTHYYCSGFLVYVAVHSWWCTFYGFCKCVMTCIYHYSIICNSFTALKILGALPVQPFHLFNPRQPLILLLSPWFCLF